MIKAYDIPKLDHWIIFLDNLKDGANRVWLYTGNSLHFKFRKHSANAAVITFPSAELTEVVHKILVFYFL